MEAYSMFFKYVKEVVQQVEHVSYPASTQPLLVEAIHSVHYICTACTDTSSACCWCYSALLNSNYSTTVATAATVGIGVTITAVSATDVNAVAAADSGSLNDLSNIDVCPVASCSVVVHISRPCMCYLILYIQLQYQVLLSLHEACRHSTALHA
jgi:hypothetical protein